MRDTQALAARTSTCKRAAPTSGTGDTRLPGTDDEGAVPSFMSGRSTCVLVIFLHESGTLTQCPRARPSGPASVSSWRHEPWSLAISFIARCASWIL